MKLDDFDHSPDVYEVDRVENGQLFLKGHPYPFKDMPTEEVVIATNILKKFLQLDVQAFKDAVEYIGKHDWAYRLRMLDLGREVDEKEWHTNPRREIKRLMRINKARDLPEVHAKLNKLANLVRFLLLFPPFKKRFTFTLPKPDEGDLYWMKQRTDYKL